MTLSVLVSLLVELGLSSWKAMLFCEYDAQTSSFSFSVVDLDVSWNWVGCSSAIFSFTVAAGSDLFSLTIS